MSRVDPPVLAHVNVKNTWSQQYAAFTFGLHFVPHGAFTCTVVTSIEKLFPLYPSRYLGSARVNNVPQVVDNQ